MIKKKYDLAIINRSFWPENEILGEAKLRVAEEISKSKRVCVVAQSTFNVKAEARKKSRGAAVTFFISKSRSNSSSSLFHRVFDAFLFGPYVFISLCRARPRHVYVSTNPPVFVPFVTFIYSVIFRAQYTYHVQDIHPEITNIVLPMNNVFFKMLRSIDNITIRNAREILTLSEDMASYIRLRSGTQKPIHLVTNPAFDISSTSIGHLKKWDLVFCGNAGRLQQIPILVEAIAKFIEDGGYLTFTFVGAGVHADKLEKLASKYDQVSYLGYLKPDLASEIVAQHRWALLPLVDEVTKYAFPSKSTSYLLAKCRILGICGPATSLSRWIDENDHGIHVAPVVEDIVDVLWKIQRGKVHTVTEDNDAKQHTISYFVNRLANLLEQDDCRVGKASP